MASGQAGSLSTSERAFVFETAALLRAVRHRPLLATLAELVEEHVGRPVSTSHLRYLVWDRRLDAERAKVVEQLSSRASASSQPDLFRRVASLYQLGYDLARNALDASAEIARRHESSTGPVVWSAAELRAARLQDRLAIAGLRAASQAAMLSWLSTRAPSRPFGPAQDSDSSTCGG